MMEVLVTDSESRPNKTINLMVAASRLHRLWSALAYGASHDEDVVVEPMTEDFALWRCLHDGPLSRETISQWPSASTMPWVRYRDRNTPLLMKLTRTYGACAI